MIIQKSFFPKAKQLRKEFDQRIVRAPFVWEYWNVPGQYRHLRTPAHLFFSKKLYYDFHKELVNYGRKELGCHDVSPPWLSCYIDQNAQGLHADVPHGPFAFVFSLTDWAAKKFDGGETYFLREQALDYWKMFADKTAYGIGIEGRQLFDEVPPKFNQLLIFDGRIPHGVREVKGIHDIRLGRIVVHGWFVNPRPFVEGGLSAAECARSFRQVDPWIASALPQLGRMHGHKIFRLSIERSGDVSRVKELPGTLRGLDSHMSPALELFEKELKTKLSRILFAKKQTPSEFTLPICFS